MQPSPRCEGSDGRLHQGSVEPRVRPTLLVLALIPACKDSTNRAVTAEMQIGFSLRVDCWLGRLSHRLPYKVVAEVDEMGLFHQLGYANAERRWPQSTIALLSGLQGDARVVAYVDDGTVFGGRSTTDHGVATVQVHCRTLLEKVGECKATV